jgi:hypothetical protein
MGEIADWMIEQYGYPPDDYEDYQHEDQTMTFEGWLKKLNTKTGSGRKGPWTLYSGKIAKADGSEYDEWVSFGFEKPDVTEGGYYVIETEKDAKGYEKVKSVKAGTPPAKAAGAASSGGGGGNAKQDTISYQAARNSALTFVEIAVKLDALPFIQSTGKAGQAKRFAELQALVDKLTVQFFHDTDTLRLLDSVEDAGAEDEPAPGSSDEDADDKSDDSDE